MPESCLTCSLQLAGSKHILGKKYIMMFVLFCFSEFGGSIDVPAIINFIDGGGNVMVAADSNIGELTADHGQKAVSELTDCPYCTNVVCRHVRLRCIVLF